MAYEYETKYPAAMFQFDIIDTASGEVLQTIQIKNNANRSMTSDRIVKALANGLLNEGWDRCDECGDFFPQSQIKHHVDSQTNRCVSCIK